MPLELNGYEARVCCGEDELEPYGCKKEDEKTVSCWIASEAGKKFSVHFTDRSLQTIMSVALEVDGHPAGSVAHPNRLTSSFRGAYDGPEHIRPFIFAALVLTDDENVTTEAVHPDLGTIRLTMTRVRRFSAKSNKPYTVHHARELRPIHEKSKKAGIHAVSFGEAERVTIRHGMTPIGQDKEPFAVFIFRYRPLSLLRANGVVPVPTAESCINQPPPTGSQGDGKDETSPCSRKRQRGGSLDLAEIKGEDDDDEDEDDLAELHQQLATIQRRIEERRAAKRTKTIKREVSPIRVPSSSTREVEVIDLT